MFGPERDMPCPGCTHMLDAIDGSALHVGQRAPLYVVAKSPIARLEAWATERRWPHLPFLSDVEGPYSADYFGDTRRLSAATDRKGLVAGKRVTVRVALGGI